MNALLTMADEPIEPGRIALVRTGVNSSDWHLIQCVNARGTVDVRPIADPPLHWDAPKRVRAADVMHLLTAAEVGRMQREQRLPAVPA